MKINQTKKTKCNTGQKHEHFTVYFNIALKKLLRVINDIDKNYERQPENGIEEHHLVMLNEFPYYISDRCYALLKDYFWQSFREAKNTSGVELNDTDKTYVQEFCLQLVWLRNAHSHFYHSNEAQIFEPETREFIEQLYERAKLSFAENQLGDIKMLENKQKADVKKEKEEFALFNLHDKKNYITPEGRMFFMSFFLNKGEMHQFLSYAASFSAGKDLTNNIFRKILTFYCHRDGVERFKYNQAETEFNSLDKELQESILEMRQAYKILNYLNNIPPETTSMDNFPLFFTNSDDNIVEIDTVTQPEKLIEIANSLNLFSSFKITLHTEKKTQVTKTKGGHNARAGKKSIAFNNDYIHQVIKIELDGFVIDLRPTDFHKILVFVLNNNQFEIKKEGNEIETISGEDFITRTLNEYISKKQEFISFLTSYKSTFGKPLNKEEQVIFEKEWNSHSHFWKSIDNALRIKLKSLARQIIIGGKDQLRSKRTQITNIKAEPIQLRFIDIFHTNDEILRRQNNFTLYAIQYIIDMEILPNWHWQHEKFDVIIKERQNETVAVNKRILSYSNKRETSRLSIDNSLQATLIYREPGDTAPDKEKRKFVIGPLALRNLLLYHFFYSDNQAPSLNSFLTQINQELDTPHNPANKLIVPKFLASHQKNEQITVEQIKKKAVCKMRTLQKELSAHLPKIEDNTFRMSRNDINQLIMSLYQLYNWEYPNNPTIKFLRKNEHQLMSVFHYCLQLDQSKRPYHLIADIPTIPQAIKVMLDNANHIKQLLQALIKDVLTERFPYFLSLIKKQDLSDTELQDLCQKLHIKKPDSHLKEKEYKKNIPYDIHPLQVIMHEESKTLEELKSFGLINQLINNGLRSQMQGLKKEQYQYQGYINYLKNLQPTTNTTFQRYVKKSERALIGSINKLLAQDMLLKKIANAYIERNNGRQDEYQLTIPDAGNIRKSTIKIPMQLSIDGKNKTYYIELYYHQIDDLLFIETKNYLNALTAYYLKHQIHKGEQPTTTISFTALNEEKVRINNDSLHLTKLLLHWEKEKLLKLDQATIDQLEVKEKGMERIDFNQYCQLVTQQYNRYAALRALLSLTPEQQTEIESPQYQLAAQLWQLEKRVRNKAFHADIKNIQDIYPKLLQQSYINTILIQPYQAYIEKKLKEQKENPQYKGKKASKYIRKN